MNKKIIIVKLELNIKIKLELNKITPELDFYADIKYINFIKFSVTHQKLRENFDLFLKRGVKTHLKMIESQWIFKPIFY